MPSAKIYNLSLRPGDAMSSSVASLHILRVVHASGCTGCHPSSSTFLGPPAKTTQHSGRCEHIHQPCSQDEPTREGRRPRSSLQTPRVHAQEPRALPPSRRLRPHCLPWLPPVLPHSDVNGLERIRACSVPNASRARCPRSALNLAVPATLCPFTCVGGSRG